MPFTGDTFTHLFDWEKEPQRQEKIVNARLEAELDGVDVGLSSLSSRVAALEAGGGTRELLAANRTYYVRTDGSDSNTGLVDSAGGAFLTIQKAVSTVATLDIAGFTVTIQVRNGTYTGATSLRNVVGFAAAGNLVIQGDTTTPGNVVISTTNASCFRGDFLHVIWDIRGFKLQTTTTGLCLYAQGGTKIRFGNIEFGASAQYHILASGPGSNITSLADYSITGGALFHAGVGDGATLFIIFTTVTVTGAPNFSVAFVQATNCGVGQWTGTTFSAGATGTRYSVLYNGVITTNGGGANFFPGNAAGSTDGFGVYA